MHNDEKPIKNQTKKISKKKNNASFPNTYTIIMLQSIAHNCMTMTSKNQNSHVPFYFLNKNY